MTLVRVCNSIRQQRVDLLQVVLLLVSGFVLSLKQPTDNTRRIIKIRIREIKQSMIYQVSIIINSLKPKRERERERERE
jgi:hypothetical protein